MELNREQIIKALECCKTPSASDCEACEYTGKCLENGEYLGCVNLLVADALSLINELTEENERLRGENEIKSQKRANIFEIANAFERGRTDGVQKMQTEIEKRCIEGGIYPAFIKSTIDQIAKEIMEEEK